MQTIYLICDPRSGEPRYVGVTSQKLRERMRVHRYTAKKTNEPWPLYKWWRKIDGLGLEPIVEVIEVTEDRHREAFWIAHYRQKSDSLLNVQPGGDFPPSLNPDTARKIGDALRGRKQTLEHRLNSGRARLGLRPTPEAIAKRKATVANRSPEERARYSANVSAARRKAIAEGRLTFPKGRVNPPESIPRGEKNGLAKLSDDDVIEMRRLFALGASTSAISRKFGVSQPNAHRIIVGQTWKHLPGACAPRGQGKKPTLQI